MLDEGVSLVANSWPVPALLRSVTALKHGQYLEQLYRQAAGEVSRRQITREQQMAQLSAAYRNSQLVLVLGAGITIEHGVPDWNTLLQKLFIEVIMSETAETAERSLVLAQLFTEFGMSDPLIAARYLSLHYRNSPAGHRELCLEEAVRTALYDRLAVRKDSALFKELGQLCAAAGNRPRLDSMITYNYDDLLETWLADLAIDIPFKAIYASGQHPDYGQLPIYHVHGFLPQKGALSKANKITLSEDIYHQQYSDIYSWNNIVQINKFTEQVCIFIGLSFTDPNLRRLLDIARLQRGAAGAEHYLVKKHYRAEAFLEQLQRYLELNPGALEEQQRASLALDETVRYLVKITELFEEKDALSFGVQIIWLDDYAQLPDLLSQIRKPSGQGTGTGY